VKKIKTQADIRHAFFDPAHGSRVRLSAASLTNPFQAPILRQEVDHDPMSMDACDGSSDLRRCDIVTTNSSALSPRDLLPLQLKANLPLQQVELDQMKTNERSQHSEELSVDKDSLRPRARAPSPWHNTLVPRHESNTRVSGLRQDVSNRISPLKLDHRSGTVLVSGAKTHLGGTGMRHSTARGSAPVFRTLSQRGPFKYFEKVSGETVVTQERWGRSHL